MVGENNNGPIGRAGTNNRNRETTGSLPRMDQLGHEEPVNVYGSVDEAEKDQFWTEFNDVPSYGNFPWVLGGDFNAIRFAVERGGELALGFNLSDHLILIGGPQPFKFETMWFESHDLVALMEQWWSQFQVTVRVLVKELDLHNQLLNLFKEASSLSKVCQEPNVGKADFLEQITCKTEHPKVILDAPYGAPTQDHKKFKVVLLIGVLVMLLAKYFGAWCRVMHGRTLRGCDCVNAIRVMEQNLHRCASWTANGHVQRSSSRAWPYPDANMEFLKSNGFQLFHFGIRKTISQMNLDSTGQLWKEQKAAGKPGIFFVSTGTEGGGQETTVLGVMVCDGAWCFALVL
ncbi:hypothetical protein IFM89_015633 [Coptis chinensis]|uniref:Uncharacterized protein n=1 Tax=Coptis chinensis TaxID=261450 RepID=A0A835ICR1_9MAGN|nr:hypothetical protein IFM89_015633 [Coptis chinensis]